MTRSSTAFVKIDLTDRGNLVPLLETPALTRALQMQFGMTEPVQALRNSLPTEDACKDMDRIRWRVVMDRILDTIDTPLLTVAETKKLDPEIRKIFQEKIISSSQAKLEQNSIDRLVQERDAFAAVGQQAWTLMQQAAPLLREAGHVELAEAMARGPDSVLEILERK